ncbi:torsin-1A-like [Sycon ciliatum]|uniref:torsin-1A-like n=1 Tax=Sycon ciliatum TaxID=27933 RepID=UPI0020ACD2E3|eukprot:scpid75275/ scgid7862/ Torsin-1B; Torsin family 1 member B
MSVVANFLVVLLWLVACAQPSLCVFGFRRTVQSAYDFVLGEPCNEHWTTYNLTQLDKALDANLFGQHLVEKYLPKLIRSHRLAPSNKALAVALHGSTGTGKTYVTQLVAQHLLKLGEQSQYFHRFIANRHFPLSGKEHVQRYKHQLASWISGNSSRCGYSLFVFEEIEKFPEGLIDEVLPFLEPFAHIEGVDYRNTIFIFTTNLGAKEIAAQVHDHYQAGHQRHKLQASIFDRVLSKYSYNSDGGFKFSSLITKQVIDLHLPFLPLESKHIKECIKVEIRKMSNHCKFTDDLVSTIANQVVYYDFGKDADLNNLFARGGCKKIRSQVHIHC